MVEINRALDAIGEALRQHLAACLATDRGNARTVNAAHQQLGKHLREAQQAMLRVRGTLANVQNYAQTDASALSWRDQIQTR